jgi:hypothetical protein
VGGGGGTPTLITLTTDFGLTDPFVGIMKGVIAQRAPSVHVVDVSHGVPPQDVMAGALVLRHAVPYFPRGTVHVAVVDPGVGSARRPLCIETDTMVLVGPDNGLLSLAAPPDDVRRIIEPTEERFFLGPRSATFHGRDVFAPVAAAIASGTPLEALGPTRDDLVRLTMPAAVREGRGLRGTIIYVDHFGNLVTSLPASRLPAGDLAIQVGAARIVGLSPSYSAVEPGELVAVIASWGLLEIAVRDGSARERLGAAVGDAVVVQEDR